MKLMLLTVLLWVSVYLKAVAAGGEPNWAEELGGRSWPTNWAYIQSSTRFTITLTNSVLRPGGTNYVHCRIENTSSNLVGVTQPITDLYLLVKPTEAYPLTRGSSGHLSRPLGAVVGPGKAHEWVLAACLKEDVPPGKYKVGAIELVGISVSDTNLPRGGQIISDLVDVTVGP